VNEWMDRMTSNTYVLLCTNQCIHHQPTVLHGTVLHGTVLYCTAEASYSYIGESNLDLV
jgi:hypothetical protein